MAKSISLSAELSAPLQLNRLRRLRWGLIGFECLFAALGFSNEFVVVSWPLIALLLVTHAATNVVLHYLSGVNRQSRLLYTLSCIIDLVLLSCLLALSGGTSNGLVALLLLPVAIGSILLPARISYLLALLSVAAYTLLLQLGDVALLNSGSDLAHQHAGHAIPESSSFSQHMLQMWWAFTLSAAMISWFVSTQAQLIQTKARQIAQLQQQQLQQEQALAIATYAANAAHDLASPIQTMALLADELPPRDVAVVELKQQLQRCQHIVQSLRVNASKITRDDEPQPLTTLVQQSLQYWLTSRPDISVVCNEVLSDAEPMLNGASSLPAALYHILDNAAQAGAARGIPKLELTLIQQQGNLTLNVRDFGEGLSERRLAELGRIPQQSEAGLGLGQFLANLTVESLGGVIERQNLADGMLTRIVFSAKQRRGA